MVKYGLSDIMHENYLQNKQLINVVNVINNMDDYFCYVRDKWSKDHPCL